MTLQSRSILILVAGLGIRLQLMKEGSRVVLTNNDKGKKRVPHMNNI